MIGLGLAEPLAADDFARLHRAHLDHHVLVFRDQRITPAQQVAFSRRFGKLQKHVLHQFVLPDEPEVLIVSNVVENGQPIGLGDAGVYWHSDLSYKERPSLGSMLHAQELPADGGDTLFANQHLAWEMLPEALRAAVADRRAEHGYLKKYTELQQKSPWRPNLSEQQVAEVPPAVHPVVRTHPETVRPWPRIVRCELDRNDRSVLALESSTPRHWPLRCRASRAASRRVSVGATMSSRWRRQMSSSV